VVVAASRPYAADVDTVGDKQALWAAVEEYDTEAAEAALQAVFDAVPLSGAVVSVVLPFLAEVGDRWEAGSLSVAHEHFISELVRRTLVAHAQASGSDQLSRGAPVVLLACPPGERHDMVLLCVSLMLRERGIRTRFLGADTPLQAIVGAARMMDADAVVLAATRATALTAQASAWRRLAADRPLYAAGRGADETTVAEIGATALPQDPARAVVMLVGALSAPPRSA